MNNFPFFDALLIVMVLIAAALMASMVVEMRRMSRKIDRLEGRPLPQKRPGFWARVWNR